jgi:hypothetical protein
MIRVDLQNPGHALSKECVAAQDHRADSGYVKGMIGQKVGNPGFILSRALAPEPEIGWG